MNSKTSIASDGGMVEVLSARITALEAALKEREEALVEASETNKMMSDTANEWRTLAESAEAECERLRDLIEEFVDDDPCQYDMHGYCQAHSLHSKPCPHERAKEMLPNRTALAAGKV